MPYNKYNRKKVKVGLCLILLLYTVLGLTYAQVTPVFEASDELWHYPMIRHLADGNSLPVQVFDPSLAGPWKQQASQPPLYYYLGAALTFWIDTSDMEQVRWLNPHVDNGIITADGNTNLTIHDPAWDPWQGTLLAVRLVRLFSVLLGLATVFLTFLLAQAVAPDRLDIALGATASVAFLPMFLFISGAVNNDNLIIFLATLTLYLLIRVVGSHHQPATVSRHLILADNWPSWTFIGVIIGLAMLTKISGVGLLLLAWGTAVLAAWQSSDRRVTLSQCLRWLLNGTGRWLLVLLPVLVIAGWWYARNIILYDDWRGWSAFVAVLGQRTQPASLEQLWGERRGFMMSYWGLFGGVNVPMSMWIYTVLNSVVIVAVIGFVIYAGKEIWRWQFLRHQKTSLPSMIANLLLFIEQHFPIVICLLWVTAVVYGLIDWTTTTWSSQGRLVFSALPALQLMLIVGLSSWFSPRFGRWPIGLLAGFMAVIAFIAPWAWIRPAYQPESYAPPETMTLTSVDARFEDGLRLTGYAIKLPESGEMMVQPGDVIDVTLNWEILEPITRNWSVFVHLNDTTLGTPIAQRDMYYGQGLRPTSLLRAGEQLTTFYRLQVPETAVSPANLELSVGVYDFTTGDRMTLSGATEDSLTIMQQLLLQALPGLYPNSSTVNFQEEVELVGFMLQPRRTLPGETINMKLFMRALRPLTSDYTFFAQVVAADTTRWAAADLTLPTSQWIPNEVHEIDIPLALATETSSNIYPVIVGIYTRTNNGGFQRLQLVSEDGRITQEDSLKLALIRVE